MNKPESPSTDRQAAEQADWITAAEPGLQNEAKRLAEEGPSLVAYRRALFQR